jgi:hypothetical protein
MMRLERLGAPRARLRRAVLVVLALIVGFVLR